MNAILGALLLLASAGPACQTYTTYSNGTMTTCTICCIGASCTVNCIGG